MWTRTRKLLTTTGTLLLLIAGVVGMNYLSTIYSTRWDATAEQSFTLSEHTQRVLKHIDQPTIISFFPLPSHVKRTEHTRRNRQAIRDLLREYAAQSDQLSLQVLPPAQFSERIQTLASRYDDIDETILLQQEPILIRQPETGTSRLISFDQVRPIRPASSGQKNNTLSISFKWGERALTTALYSLTRKRRISICVKGSAADERSNESSSNRRTFTSIKRELTDREGFRLKNQFQLSKLTPSTCDVLLLLPGADSLSDGQRANIQSYLNGGGSVIVLAEPEVSYGLRSVFSAYGIDVTNAKLPAPTSRMRGLPSVERIDWYRPHPITSPLIETEYPVYMRGVQVVTETGETRTDTETSLLLGAQRNRAKLEASDNNLTSYLVSDNRGTALPVAAAAQRSVSGERKKQAKLVVFGDADWVTDPLLSKLNMVERSGNVPLLLNTVRWSAGISDELRIIPEPQTNPTVIVTEAQAGAIFTLVVFLIPGCFFLVGTMVWWLRRMRY